jgi:hypothetical protein
VRRVLAVVLAAVLLAAGGGVAVASTTPTLDAHGQTQVHGTEATAVFRIGGRTIRQVRYADGKTLVYTFRLSNDGRVPVKVTGLAPLGREPRLFRYTEITDAAGHEEFTIAPGERTTVELRMHMHGCESLSARAGSFATEVRLQTQRVGLIHDVVTVEFPEEIHTGSPREAFCPNSTATSRPPG